jgi:hypothetical protein
MARNAGSVSDSFNIPANRVVESGTPIEIRPVSHQAALRAKRRRDTARVSVYADREIVARAESKPPKTISTQ